MSPATVLLICKFFDGLVAPIPTLLFNATKTDPTSFSEKLETTAVIVPLARLNPTPKYVASPVATKR